jgi:charged multivesicular body protein 2A
MSQWVSWIWGLDLYWESPADRLQRCRLDLHKAGRAIGTDLARFRDREHAAVAEMKTHARGGQVESVKTLARVIVRTRGCIKECEKMKERLEAIDARLMRLQTADEMARVVQSAAQAMAAFNQHASAPSLRRVTSEYRRQGILADERVDAMTDAAEDSTETVGGAEDADVDDIVSQVLEEAGLDTDLADVPRGRPIPPTGFRSNQRVATAGGGAPPDAVGMEDTDIADMQRRMKQLGGGR